ncbi:MAG: formylglycine-generating enzyme family protein [Pseudomonadota bacterium]
MAVLESIVDASFHPLADGTAPEWATAWGEDAFGVWVEFSVGAVTQRMRWCPPGTFPMGSPKTEFGRYGDEGPQHSVTLTSGYWMFDTPCTQALWVAVMGENPSKHQADDCPVESVSWNDCQAFIETINARIPALELSLPTEAQWEYACRAGTQTATYAGDARNEEELVAALEDIAWFDGTIPDSRFHVQPVKLKRPNAWGLYDTLGNVDEWCSTGGFDYQPEVEVDPFAEPEARGDRVIRGGSWVGSARFVRAAFRFWFEPGVRIDNLGFRAARVQRS